MNKDNAAQYLPLVQALAEGRVIQESVADAHMPGYVRWDDIDEPRFVRAPGYYRIKAEPRKAWVWWPHHDAKNDGTQLFFMRELADKQVAYFGGHITEVTE